MASTAKEVARELPNRVKVYKDGTVERLFGSPYVQPSPDIPDPETKVLSKDIHISHSQHPKIPARLYLPALAQEHNNNPKLPILVYFHGGAFCGESAFSLLHHRYVNNLVSQAQVLAISVEYKLAPEHPLPAAYDDSWHALKWVTSHFGNRGRDDDNKERWILDYGDFDRVFIGGDSAGGNIVHNLAMRAGAESLPENVKIIGGFVSHPFFWGSKPIGKEPTNQAERLYPALIWDFVYPSAPGGIDNPLINPAGPDGPSLDGLGCAKLLVCVAEKDGLRDRGVLYYQLVKESGWRGEVELFEVEGEGHVFHMRNPDTQNAKKMFKRLASFLSE